MSPSPSQLPSPPHERWPLALALLALAASAGLLALALTGGGSGQRAGQALAQPPATPQVVVVTPTPAPVSATPAVDTAAPKRRTNAAAQRRFTANDLVQHVPATWVAGFYPIYAAAQRRFSVNWLLIASIHKQETAFSTHPTTYHGLNFANCCAGPMQFNITNGGHGMLSTWARYRESFRAAARPAIYPHATVKHPSIYDDFDAIMAAGALLRDNGAGSRLDASAWRAAYDYYGHDLTGVSYADEVLARAIGWGQHRFCVNCATVDALRSAVDAAWGAPVRAEMAPPPMPAAKKQGVKKAKGHAPKAEAAVLR
jgi:hypothetical protein